MATTTRQGECDSQAGIDKNYLRQFFRNVSLGEVDSLVGMLQKKQISACTVGTDGTQISLAELFCSLLQDDQRCHGGRKGYRKHQKQEESCQGKRPSRNI